MTSHNFPRMIARMGLSAEIENFISTSLGYLQVYLIICDKLSLKKYVNSARL